MFVASFCFSVSRVRVRVCTMYIYLSRCPSLSFICLNFYCILWMTVKWMTPMARCLSTFYFCGRIYDLHSSVHDTCKAIDFVSSPSISLAHSALSFAFRCSRIEIVIRNQSSIPLYNRNAF